MNYQDNNNRNYPDYPDRSVPYDDTPDVGRRYRDDGDAGYNSRGTYDSNAPSYDRSYDEDVTRIYNGSENQRPAQSRDSYQRYDGRDIRSSSDRYDGYTQQGRAQQYDGYAQQGRAQQYDGYAQQSRPQQQYRRQQYDSFPRQDRQQSYGGYPQQSMQDRQYRQSYNDYPQQNRPRQQYQRGYDDRPQQSRPRQQRPRNYDSSFDVNPVGSSRGGRGYNRQYDRRDDYNDSYNGSSRPRTAYNDGYRGYGGGVPGGGKPKKKKKKSSTAITVVRVIAVLLLLVGVFLIGKKLLSYYFETKNHGKLQDMLSARGLQGMYDQNSDLFGWLEIEDTVVDYPVMYTPYDPEKYLHTNFEGNYSDAGELFIDSNCNTAGCHFLIYGHHMNNGSMFGSLPDYEDYDYYQQHKIVKFDTLTEVGEYEIFAVFYSQIYDDYDDVFKYYECADLYNEEIYNYYVSNVKSLSIYDTGITPTYGEKIVTLSTCNYHTQDGRFVVCAKKIN